MEFEISGLNNAYNFKIHGFIFGYVISFNIY